MVHVISPFIPGAAYCKYEILIEVLSSLWYWSTASPEHGTFEFLSLHAHLPSPWSFFPSSCVLSACTLNLTMCWTDNTRNSWYGGNTKTNGCGSKAGACFSLSLFGGPFPRALPGNVGHRGVCNHDSIALASFVCFLRLFPHTPALPHFGWGRL